MNLYYDKLQKTAQDQHDAERYAEKRKMTEAEKKETIFRMSKAMEAAVLAVRAKILQWDA